ncbi:MAG: polymer-forming cytoskeletal protein [Candidatus Rokubacteria bacterium]|nr:polymer-forming cytoskeletal protein [Candidatus Rokubacteria bacterium]
MSPFAAVLRFLGLGGDAPPADGRPRPPIALGGLVGEGLVMKGEVSGEGDFQVLGKFEGEIMLTGTVHVGEGAEVDANISATAIVIAGIVRGNLSASTRVEILPTGTLTGTLKSGSFTAAEGATVKGEVWVERPARPALAERAAPSVTAR